MPNVEIHGLDQSSARHVRHQIFNIFRNTSCVDDMVVTIFPTNVTDVHDIDRPFLRLVNSCQAHTDNIIVLLGALGMDIEYLQLAKFIPKPG